MKKFVVIGSSAAGVNGIRELRKYDKDAEIVLISKDKDIYSRCILHEYLAGKRSIERLRFVEKDFETLYRVNWKKGIEAEIFSALKGNTALMLSNTGNAPAKLIKEFTKGDKTGEAKPQLKAAYVEETVYVGKQNLEFLCSIKSKNELIAELVALLQSPAKNVVSALQSGQNTIHGVLQTLGERAE